MEQLGINILWILAYTGLFLVIYLFARNFIRKTIKTYETRQRIIEEGVQNARDSEVLKAQAMDKAEAEKKDIIQQAYTSAQEIVEKAREHEAAIIKEAYTKAEKIIADAKSELEKLRKQAKTDGLGESKEIIALAIKKAFEDTPIDHETEEKFIENSLQKA